MPNDPRYWQGLTPPRELQSGKDEGQEEAPGDGTIDPLLLGLAATDPTRLARRAMDFKQEREILSRRAHAANQRLSEVLRENDELRERIRMLEYQLQKKSPHGGLQDNPFADDPGRDGPILGSDGWMYA